jgi:hypothetical protein
VRPEQGDRFLEEFTTEVRVLAIEVRQRHQLIRLSNGEWIAVLSHIFERVPYHVQIHGFEMQEEKLSSAFLVEMAACQLCEMYEEWVNYDAWDISQDDSLLFCRAEVNAELCSVSKEQKAAGVGSEHFSGIEKERNLQAHIHVFQRYIGEGIKQWILVISKQ